MALQRFIHYLYRKSIEFSWVNAVLVGLLFVSVGIGFLFLSVANDRFVVVFQFLFPFGITILVVATIWAVLKYAVEYVLY